MFLLVILCRKTRGGMDSFQLLGLVGEGEIRAGGIVYKSPQGQQGDGALTGAGGGVGALTGAEGGVGALTGA